MSNLVTLTPIPFDDVVLPFTKTDSFDGAGGFLQWSNAGPYEAAGLLWRVCFNIVPPSGLSRPNFLNVYSSADGGLTWTERNAAGRPQLTAAGGAPKADVTFGHDGKFYIVSAAPSVGANHITVNVFDTATALWGTAIVGPLSSTGLGVVNDISIYQDSTTTDLIIFYDRSSGINDTIIWIRVTAGVFAAENILRAAAVNNFAPLAVIDAGNVARCFFSDAGVSTYQAINPDDSLGAAVPTGWNVGLAGNVPIFGKPVSWQGAIALPALGKAFGNSQPFALLASPASSPAVFTAAQVFSEPLPSDLTVGDRGFRMVIDGAGALWMAWSPLSHAPGSSADPVTVSQIGMAQLCAPGAAWKNHQVFWDQLTDPQTDQPLNSPDAIVFENFSLSYLPTSGTFNGIANISGLNNTYAYYLKSTTTAASITMCGAVKRCLQ